MNVTTDTAEGTRRSLMRALLHNKRGMTVQALAQAFDISRNAIRQHLTSLERDGLVERGRIQPSGGRPEQLYVLTNQGEEQFPRQYSWFSELLLKMLQTEAGSAGLTEKLAEMGRSLGDSMKERLADKSGSTGRIAAIAEMMQEIGYEAIASTTGGEKVIEAHNCVFHKLAVQCPEVCSFDLALLATCSGYEVEHRSCMIRGGDACRFHFVSVPYAEAGKKARSGERQ